MAQRPPEELFRANAVGLCNTICVSIEKLNAAGYETVPIALARMIPSAISVMNSRSLIEGFINGCHLKNEDGSFNGIICWDYMKRRDEQFFIENVHAIFAALPPDNVNLFVSLFTTKDKDGNSVISKRLKDNVWDTLDAMIKLSIKYVHINRAPFSMVTPEGTKNMYNAKFLDYVNMSHNKSIWNVVLDFPLKE